VPLEIVIPLLLFVILALLLALAIRRAGRFLATTREADAFRSAVNDLGDRIATSLGAVIERVDAVRRHQMPPQAIEANLTAGTDAVIRYTDEVRGLRAPVAVADKKESLVAELERAGRALDMVVHGCGLMASQPGPARELEAQTSIKRGYLNLIHAREAIARLAAEVAAAPLPGGQAFIGRRVLSSRTSPRDHTM
jgi:hypothetical protein